MANLNGQLILDALQTLDEPATFQNVVSMVAKTCGMPPDQVQDSVKKILQGGVKHGYVQYANRKYYAAEYDDDDDIVTIKDKSGKEQPEDSSRRRRRSGSRRRRRSGSRRSRSRRRRR